MTRSRTQRRKQHLREAILAAAHELFAHQGVSATTIEDICERADIANRTFFNHFSHRRELMQALAERELATVCVAVDASLTPRSPRPVVAFFDAVAAALAGSDDAHRELSAVLIDATGYGGPRGTRLHALAVQAVKRGAAQRTVTSDYDPEVLADIIIGTLTTTIAEWAGQRTFSLTERLQHLGAALADLLAPALQGTGGDAAQR